MNLVIEAIRGIEDGKKQSYTKFPISIGRLSESDFRINDPFVSRQHCTIYEDGRRFIVRDLNSTNGTFVNGNVVSDPLPLSNGDKLQFGESVLRIQIKLGRRI